MSKRGKRKPIDFTKVISIIAVITYVIMQIITIRQEAVVTVGTLSYNEVLEMIDEDKVEVINITKDSNKGTLIDKSGNSYTILNTQSDKFIDDLAKRGAKIGLQKTSLSSSIIAFVLTVPIMILFIVLIVYMIRVIAGSNVKMFKVTKAKDNNVTFDDIRGLSESKEEARFIVNQVEKYKELDKVGARPVKGLILYGPSGVGKTLIAKAIAHEANVPFISVSGADFSYMFAGVGAARVRSLWDLACMNAPCVLFIDEIDCLGNKRMSGDGAAEDHNQTLNALLQKMDGLEKNPGVLVIAATNRLEALDEALLRPGRFDRKLYIGVPDNKKDRDDIVELYINKKQLDKEVTVEKASKLLFGFSGASIEATLNEAVFISMREGREGKINLADIDEASMKIRLNGVKKKHTSDEDRKITAIHEAGHTIVSLVLNIPVAKTSIIEYTNGTGGVTIRDTDSLEDKKLKMESDFINDIIVLLAGKCAEEAILNEHSQGCSADIEEATKIAYSMVTQYGYGETLFNENVLISNNITQKITNKIYEQCNKILDECNNSAGTIINKYSHLVELYSDMLLKEDTIVMPNIEEIEAKIIKDVAENKMEDK